MVGNVGSYGVSAYTISAVSVPKAQTGSGARSGTQQPAPSTTNSSSDRLSISQAGKALAANGNKSTADLTDVKVVAKEHLAQQKLAYEQKYGTTTAASGTTSSQNSEKASSAKPPVDLTDVKVVAKEHLAQQKLAYEQKYGTTAVASGTTSSQNSEKASSAKKVVDLTDAKAVTKEHLAQQQQAYEQKLGVITAASAAATYKQQSGAVGSYQAIQSLLGS